MQLNLDINGVDFKPWLAENGLKYSFVERARTSVITIDGVDHRKVIRKRQIDVTLYDLPDEELIQVENAIAAQSPAMVNYTDKNGTEKTGVLCYVSDPETVAKSVVAGTTYWGEITFSIEER